MAHRLWLGLGAAGIMALSYAPSLATEARTERIRRWFGAATPRGLPATLDPPIAGPATSPR